MKYLKDEKPVSVFSRKIPPSQVPKTNYGFVTSKQTPVDASVLDLQLPRQVHGPFDLCNSLESPREARCLGTVTVFGERAP